MLQNVQQNIWKMKYAKSNKDKNLGGFFELTTKFPKQRGLDRTSTFRGVVAGKEGVTFFRGSCNCHIRDRLKSEIFNDNTVCKQKYFSLS